MKHNDPKRRSLYTVRESVLVILAPLTLFTEDEIKNAHTAHTHQRSQQLGEENIGS